MTGYRESVLGIAIATLVVGCVACAKRYEWLECRQFGHTTAYCLLKAMR